MCGILGSTISKDNFEDALKTISYRGPNGSRIVNLPKCKLGFVRLSIRDLSEKAMQPMISEDKNTYLLFNGEIYGYENLKSKLVKKGYLFNTTSDTEVLLRAYQEYGTKFVDMIDGIFAIAIYDFKKNQLYLFRDRVGVKPLFYYYDGVNLTFASEMKAILKYHDNITFKRDNTAIYDYFTYRYIPEPKTLFHNIYKLEPACRLTYDFNNKKIDIQKYWKLRVNTAVESTGNDTEISKNVKKIIGESVTNQLVSDVPVGTFLSGGIDSSIVSTEIYRRTKNVHAFSMGFQITNSQEKGYDETEFAKLLSNKYNFDITYGKFDRHNLRNLKNQLSSWYDEPFADNSAFPTYMISRMAKEYGVPVVLTGDGGDEVFGGYLNYERFANQVKDRKSWSFVYDLFTKVMKPYFVKEELMEEMIDAVSLFAKGAYAFNRKEKNEYIKKLGIGVGYDDFWYFRKYYHKELPPITRAQYIDFMTYLPADILTKVDRASMQNSIETRVPLLSKQVIEFAFGLSQEDRCPNGELKGLLKRAYSNLIPHEILYKDKKGFSVPGSYWTEADEYRFWVWKENWAR